ncbi:MAG: proton-translocating transhydrogenase family protein, partial [Desulfotignum sp.]
MTNLLLMAGVFVFSFVVGYFLISRIPTLLHTPLMSMTNAISA